MVAPTKDEIKSLFDAHAQGVAVSAEKARNFDDARTWVDPNGYRLSDRIWNGREANRDQINQILRDGVANRQDALVTAKQLEQFLNPAFAVTRNADGRIVPAESKGLSKTVRGRGGTGSYAARRLAVTEVSRAHAQEVGRVAKETPFAIGQRWNLSPQHPKVDGCDNHATLNVGLGPGVYPIDGFPRMPDHPWCMCYATVETADDDTVIKALRQEFGLAEGPGLERLDRPLSDEVPGAPVELSVNARYNALRDSLAKGEIDRPTYLAQLQDLKAEAEAAKAARAAVKVVPKPSPPTPAPAKLKPDIGIPDDDLAKSIDERVLHQRDQMFSGKIDYTEYERREKLIRASTPQVTEIPIITAPTTKLEKAITGLADDTSGAIKQAEARGWSPQMARADAEKWIEGGAFKVDEPIFHFTKEEYVDSILKNGLKGTDGTYGHGIYTTLDKVGNHTGRDGLPVRLELRINMKNPLRTKYYNGNKAFREAIGDAEIKSTADINRILKAQGYDGIILDMDGIISDWVWAFDTEAITVVDVVRGADLAQDLKSTVRRIDSILDGPIPNPTSVPMGPIDDAIHAATELSINKRYTILKGQLDAGAIDRDEYLRRLKELKDEAVIKKGGKVLPKPDPTSGPTPPIGEKPPWQASMTDEDAAAWAADGKYADRTFYHFTSDEAAESIRREGFRNSDGNFGPAIYTTESGDASGIGRQFTNTRLTVKTDAKNVLEIDGGVGDFNRKMKELGADLDDPFKDLDRLGYDGILVKFNGKQEPWFITNRKDRLVVIDPKAPRLTGTKSIPKPRPPVIDKPPMPDPGLSISKQYEILKDQQAKGLITRQDYLERLDVLKQRKALGKAAPKPAPLKPTPKPKDPFVDKVQARIAKGLNTEADVREVGEIVREEVEAKLKAIREDPKVLKRLKEIEDELEGRKPRLFELQKVHADQQFGRGPGLTHAERFELDRMYSRGAEIITERQKLEALLKGDPAQVTRDTLARVRSMGGKDSGIKFHPAGAVDKQALTAVKDALDFVPTEWADDLARVFERTGQKYGVNQVKRGYYNDTHKTIAISGTNKAKRLQTAVHELAHAIEYARPGITALERQFFERRTRGETTQWLGAGYNRDEVTKKDKFLNPYMGKEYARTFEILSMGIEGILSPGFNGYDLITKDKDFADFILGLLGAK